jgi:tetratricopeptide (TPR) repeat protein
MNSRLTIIIFFLVVVKLNAQNHLSIQLEYANNLMTTHQYFDAVTEFKRILFFDTNNKYTFIANKLIGKCYKAGAKFDDAIKYFSTAQYNAKTDDEKISAQLEIIKANILRKTTERAHQILNELENFDSIEKDSINYWRGWAYIFSDEWSEASKSFGKINVNHELKKLADQVEKDKVSVTFANVISYILPGSGQIYSGYILPGLISLGWNLLAGYWTVSAFNESRVFDGSVLIGLVWLRFYRGNVQSAGDFAIQKNNEISNKALRYLQNEYKGSKP